MAVVIYKKLEHALEFLHFSGREAPAKFRSRKHDGKIGYLVAERRLAISLLTEKMTDLNMRVYLLCSVRFIFV